MGSMHWPRHSFSVSGKKVAVYPSAKAGAPAVCLNAFGEEGDKVLQALRKAACPDFSLVAIGGLEWDRDMAPWDIPPISKDDTPCTGGADEYLGLLAEEIMPRAESFLSGEPSWRGIAGYSLAGLFALYSLYHIGLFSRVACMSASLWFPGFKEYVFSHKMKASADHLYFSLGDREALSKNPYLRPVQENTEAICSFYKKGGLDAVFELNPGGHYKDAVKRTAAGILWILAR